MTNIYYKSTYRTTMTNNINIMQWICTGNYSMTSDESVAHINIVLIQNICLNHVRYYQYKPSIN